MSIGRDRAWELIDGCLAEAGPLRASPWHGERHWMRVAITGAHLIDHSGAGDPLIALCFALLHDARRENEHQDPGHGPRAAQLARDLNDDLLRLGSCDLDLLVQTIHDHNGAGASDDPTRGLCFDADRLNLWRVGTIPDPRFLSLAYSRREEAILWGRDLQEEAVSWERVVDLYAGR